MPSAFHSIYQGIKLGLYVVTPLPPGSCRLPILGVFGKSYLYINLDPKRKDVDPT